jgi:hypothetical protein
MEQIGLGLRKLLKPCYLLKTRHDSAAHYLFVQVLEDKDAHAESIQRNSMIACPESIYHLLCKSFDSFSFCWELLEELGALLDMHSDVGEVWVKMSRKHLSEFVK